MNIILLFNSLPNGTLFFTKLNKIMATILKNYVLFISKEKQADVCRPTPKLSFGIHKIRLFMPDTKADKQKPHLHLMVKINHIKDTGMAYSSVIK